MMLVSKTQLMDHLHDPAWVIFDCRHDLVDHAKGPRLYQENHIPGAFLAPVETALSGARNGFNGRHPLPTPNTFAAFLAAHGVSAASTVVAYDDSGGLYAARLWWLARWIGIKSVALLDGGIPRWIADGGVVTKELPKPRPATLAAHVDGTLVWSAKAVLSRLSDPSYMIIDARAADRFRGEVEPIDPVAGHIPGALNRFYKSNLQADLTFRPADELKKEFNALIQNRPPGNVVHQCGSGITACANLFAMEYAGLPDSKLYAGSWSEWVADPSRPVARGATN
jgi:thiosulfate/3-mercaptopyruvate sulfurtransferase